MSLPNVPDIKPYIDLPRGKVINLLLASIAMEEIALSHILNAEGEKLQLAIKAAQPPKYPVVWPPKNGGGNGPRSQESDEVLEEEQGQATGGYPPSYPKATLDDVLKFNASVQETLALAIKKELLLDDKLRKVIDLIKMGQYD